MTLIRLVMYILVILSPFSRIITIRYYLSSGRILTLHLPIFTYFGEGRIQADNMVNMMRNADLSERHEAREVSLSGHINAPGMHTYVNIAPEHVCSIQVNLW